MVFKNYANVKLFVLLFIYKEMTCKRYSVQ